MKLNTEHLKVTPYEPTYKSLFEISYEFINPIKNLNPKYFTELSYKFEMEENKHNNILTVWNYLDTIDDVLYEFNINDILNIKINMHDKNGVTYKKYNGEYIVTKKEFDCDWNLNTDCIIMKYTFISKK